MLPLPPPLRVEEVKAVSQQLVLEEGGFPPCHLPSLDQELRLLQLLVSLLPVLERRRQTWAGSRQCWRLEGFPLI